MITVNIMGGLGNQLFQISTAIATALRKNDIFFFFKRSDLCLKTRHKIDASCCNLNIKSKLLFEL